MHILFCERSHILFVSAHIYESAHIYHFEMTRNLRRSKKNTQEQIGPALTHYIGNDIFVYENGSCPSFLINLYAEVFESIVQSIRSKHFCAFGFASF